MIRVVLGILLLLSGSSYLYSQGIYDLETYLKDVRTKNHDIISSQSAIKGSSGTSEASSLGFSPIAFTSYTYTDDKADNSLKTLGASESKTSTLMLGVSQKFRYGFNLDVKYALIDVKYDKTSEDIPSENYISSPSLSLKISLWQDIGGRSSRAQEQAALSGSQAKIYAEKYKIRMTEYQAELTYWGLALARRMVEIQQDNLSRAKKQLDWTKSRYNRSLADASDLVQIEALVQNYTLALKQAQESVRSTSISFNNMRGSESLQVNEKLQPFNTSILEKLKVPTSVGYRTDVKAALYSLEASKLQAKLSKDKLRPSLDLSSTYSLKNIKGTRSDALSDSFETDTPTWSVGLTLSTPLDFGILSRAKAGYDHEVAAAKENFDKQVIDQKVEWQNYLKKLQYSKENLAHSTKLKEIQKTKLQYEKDKYNKGRTTLFQVLSYETEYASSTANELTSLLEVVKNYAYLKTYVE